MTSVSNSGYVQTAINGLYTAAGAIRSGAVTVVRTGYGAAAPVVSGLGTKTLGIGRAAVSFSAAHPFAAIAFAAAAAYTAWYFKKPATELSQAALTALKTKLVALSDRFNNWYYPFAKKEEAVAAAEKAATAAKTRVDNVKQAIKDLNVPAPLRDAATKVAANPADNADLTDALLLANPADKTTVEQALTELGLAKKDLLRAQQAETTAKSELEKAKKAA